MYVLPSSLLFWVGTLSGGRLLYLHDWIGVCVCFTTEFVVLGRDSFWWKLGVAGCTEYEVDDSQEESQGGW